MCILYLHRDADAGNDSNNVGGRQGKCRRYWGRWVARQTQPKPLPPEFMEAPMRKLLTITLLFLILLIPLTGDAQQFIVRTVYFQPTDAPAPSDRIANLMLEVQDFYQSEMERHGYDGKTFRLENNADGNPDIHIVKGRHPAIHYISDTYNQLVGELPFNFRRQSIVGQNNIHVIFLAGSDRVDGRFLGVGYPYSQFHSGGNAVVAGNKATVTLVAHELGHAFGLFHTGVIGALMGSGSDFLINYEARWLDNHHFFNERHIKTDIPEAVLDFPIEAIGGGTIRFKIVARSESGLYHAQLCRKRGTYILGYDDTLKGESDIIQVDASRGRLINGDSVWFQIMDVNGNYYFHHIPNIVMPEPSKGTDKDNKNPDIIVQVPKPEPENKVAETVDCPDCEPEIIENELNEHDLNILPRPRLTTKWAILKIR